MKISDLLSMIFCKVWQPRDTGDPDNTLLMSPVGYLGVCPFSLLAGTDDLCSGLASAEEDFSAGMVGSGVLASDLYKQTVLVLV